MTASVGEYVPNFFPLGFWVSYQATHVISLASVTLFRNICIPFFIYDVELSMLFRRL